MKKINLRRACLGDARKLAYLLVQLYQSEFPGIICGSLEQNINFIYQCLLNEGIGGIDSHYLVVDECGVTVGTIGLHFPEDGAMRFNPKNVFYVAFLTLGVMNMVKMLINLIRASMFSIYFNVPSNVAYIHSFVVDERFRRRGFGVLIINEIENIALEGGQKNIYLSVVSSNIDAKRFFLRCGYRRIIELPRRIRSLTFLTDVFCKSLS